MAITLKETHNPSKIGLENWSLGLWEKIIVLKWVFVSLKLNIFRSLQLQWSVPVSGNCLRLVVSELFMKGSVDSWSDWFGRNRGLWLHAKKIAPFF